ncbi:putative pak-box p21-rho-binding protein [Erysiphe neolycopersici]|uniref:Putative pak-box p21-rho-binding protein n=1 Tax=Erysiphe neolycopersici TaxID=212602 RepID=A0A420HUS9_9PEZI|nr:putative pak-box p21-rho-binding protein [Erysiphe neolycopersici]
MFRGKPTMHTHTYSATQDHYFLKRDALETLHPTISYNEYSQLAEDGIPLPELMRSHTEESRLAMHSEKSHIRTKTLSSLYLSTGSRDISYKENLAFSRRIANRLDLSNTHRPDSVHGLVSIFSRNVWKEKKERLVGRGSRASTSGITARDANLMAKSHDSEFPNSCNTISIPYNFRHLSHTLHDKVPHATQSIYSEQVSDSNSPNSLRNRMGFERQVLSVDNLHFENFSSETVNTQNCDERRPISAVEKFRARQRTVLRKKKIPCENKFTPQVSFFNETRNSQNQTQKSASSLPYIMESIPARNSSRTPSNADLVSSSSTELSYTKSEWENSLSQGGDSWPLSNSTNSSCFMVELPDVEEEEENSLASPNQDISSVENCGSFDYDEKTLGSVDDLESISESRSPAEWDPLQVKRVSSLGESHSICLDLEIRSWESDIDWCYENEVEADCDYRWIEEEVKESQDEDLKTHEAVQAPQLMLQVDEPMNVKNFRPSLLLPERVRSPGLSSDSVVYTTLPTPPTPVNFRQDHYIPNIPKISSPDEPAHMDDFQSEVTTSDFQTQLLHETDFKGSFVKDYFSVISSPISDNSSMSLSEEGSSKSTSDRSWSYPQTLPSSRCSSTHTSSSLGDQEAFNLRKDTAKVPLFDRRKKKLHLDAKVPKISSSIPPLHDSRSFESLKTGGLSIQRGRPTTRLLPDRKVSASFTDQNTNKSRSTSQISTTSRLKCSYGLFPQV